MREKLGAFAGMRFIRGIIRCAALGIFVLTLSPLFRMKASAAALYTNPETEYAVILEDDADLLTDEEEADLAEQMKGITKWGNAAFKSIDENHTSTERYIENYYKEKFGQNSGTVFLIDMDNRNIWIKNNGEISLVVTNSYSDTITDNSYRYASRGDYYGCAKKVFGEIETLLSGRRIAQPMKYVSNAILAMILALLFNYFLMRRTAKNRVPERHELLAGMRHHYVLTNQAAEHLRQTKRYDPQSSDSDSSSGSSSSGGGSSGSGGGHSF